MAKGLTMKVVGDELIITCNLKERHGLSTSKKTIIVATSEGNASIGYKDFKVGVTLYTKEGVEAAVAAEKRAKENEAKQANAATG